MTRNCVYRPERLEKMRTELMRPSRWQPASAWALPLASLVLLVPAFASIAFAHNMAGKDAAFVASSTGPQILPFLYLGAKHMATGYDHLLFVIGTVFFLYKLKHVAIYVTTFSIGHSITLLLGVLGGVHVN